MSQFTLLLSYAQVIAARNGNTVGDDHAMTKQRKSSWKNLMMMPDAQQSRLWSSINPMEQQNLRISIDQRCMCHPSHSMTASLCSRPALCFSSGDCGSSCCCFASIWKQGVKAMRTFHGRGSFATPSLPDSCSDIIQYRGRVEQLPPKIP